MMQRHCGPNYNGGLIVSDVLKRPHEGETVGGIAVERLRSVIERVERLEEEKKAISNEIKDIFSEAKSAGFDVRTIKSVLKLRRLEPKEIEESENLLDIYRRALGM